MESNLYKYQARNRLMIIFSHISSFSFLDTPQQDSEC
jgi:hypothetical protein